MDFKRHVFSNFDRIMGEKTIFVIKSKDFHLERPFFPKKNDFTRRDCVSVYLVASAAKKKSLLLSIAVH